MVILVMLCRIRSLKFEEFIKFEEFLNLLFLSGLCAHSNHIKQG